MKKVLSVLVILGFVIGMAACSNKKAEEEQRIADSIHLADSMAVVQAQMDSIVAADQAAAVLEQARLDSIAAAEAAVPVKKTTVKKTTKVEPAVPATKSIRGGGTSGTK